MRAGREEREAKKPRNEEIRDRLIQVAAVEKIEPLDNEYSGKVELTIVGENGAAREVTKFCLDTGATESVANMNNFPIEGYREFPLQASRFVKLADATTLYPVRKAVQVDMKAKVGGAIAEAHDQVIYLVEGPKQMTALLVERPALKSMGLVNRNFFPTN